MAILHGQEICPDRMKHEQKPALSGIVASGWHNKRRRGRADILSAAPASLTGFMQSSMFVIAHIRAAEQLPQPGSPGARHFFFSVSSFNSMTTSHITLTP